jgi:hypothetical protein
LFIFIKIFAFQRQLKRRTGQDFMVGRGEAVGNWNRDREMRKGEGERSKEKIEEGEGKAQEKGK